MSLPWDPKFAWRSPLFDPLRRCAARLDGAGWPGLDDFNRLVAEAGCPVGNSAGMPIRFVPHDPGAKAFPDQYEPRVFLRGEVQTRTANWHDLFNSLAWCAFPRTKAALNARHYAAMTRERRGGNRGRGRDAATLFDESGVIVASSDPELARLLGGFRWKALFWERRVRVGVALRFFIMGHALYEKALAPFLGMTGMGLVMGVEHGFFSTPLEEQLAYLDEKSAARVADEAGLRSPDDLAPVPVLGYPGWDPANDREDYYDNASYFRPGRTRRSA